MVVWNSTQSEAFASQTLKRHRRACERLRNCATSILLRNLPHVCASKNTESHTLPFETESDTNMSIQFLNHMDIKFVLDLQNYLLPSECEICVMLCKTVQMRFRHLSYELTIGYCIKTTVMDAGRFWKSFDLDFQLKNRERWDDLARQYFALERNAIMYWLLFYMYITYANISL